MKKTPILSSVIGIIAVIAVVLYLTRAIEIYTVSTTSNEPTLKNGSWVLASKLKTPEHGDFIAFEKDKYFWLFRCIAKGGDVVEIKNTVVYVNGKALAEPYTMKEYNIPTKEILNMSDYLTKNNIATREIYYGSSLIALSDDQFKNLKKNLKLFSKLKNAKADENLFPYFAKKGFNEDNLGPIKVPANRFFVLGDNRHNAFDSRYFGFVKESEITSTVVF